LGTSIVPILSYGIVPPTVQSLSVWHLASCFSGATTPLYLPWYRTLELGDRHCYRVLVNICMTPQGTERSGINASCPSRHLHVSGDRGVVVHALPLSLLPQVATQSIGATCRREPCLNSPLGHPCGAGGMSSLGLICLHGVSMGVAAWHHRTGPGLAHYGSSSSGTLGASSVCLKIAC
jgi:hypothetical protein